MNRTNSFPISSKTFLFPFDTESLALSSAVIFNAFQIDFCKSFSFCFDPTSKAAKMILLIASSVQGCMFSLDFTALIKSSLRIVCPACFDAHVAKVHQFASTAIRSANAFDIS